LKKTLYKINELLERLMKFLEEAEYSKEDFEDILDRFNLKSSYSEFRNRMK